LTGQVKCPNGSTFKDVVITITGTSCLGSFSDGASTDSDGLYVITLPDCDGSYTATLDVTSLPPNATLVSPASVSFSTTTASDSFVADWEIGGAVCEQAACWFTGGGAKIDQLLGIPCAHCQSKPNGKTPDLAFGGNVYPGCSPTAGDGGSWNHVDRIRNLHFHGTTIQVVRCGNVTPPPPPGSTSPVTPFNFIEFQGTGTLKGIQGNKVDYGTVYFFARAEDRNEPGSKGANDGALIDRYHLRVYTNPADPFGSTVLLVGGNDADPANNAVPITDGNFQLHISSCDNPPTP